MSTLVYFASGPNRDEYQSLNFDKIYLIDNYFRNERRNINRVFEDGKVTCVGMDCLESVEFLRNENVQIDCFVSLNEGLFEGGGRYAINSDMFLGYIMPLLKDNYIHIMNKNYYCGMYNVTMDLPYSVHEIGENDKRYLDPMIFSKEDYHVKHAKVFVMTRLNSVRSEDINPKIRLSVHHDSIWNHYDSLDALALSISEQGQHDFFDRIPKVLNMKKMSVDDVLAYCVENKISRIGFTSLWRRVKDHLFETIKNCEDEYPKEILYFHLNRLENRGL